MKKPDEIRSLRMNAASARAAAFQRHGQECMACGLDGSRVPLEVAHIIPFSEGGVNTPDNLLVLCPNCHRALDRGPREAEFQQLLTLSMDEHPNFIVTGKNQLIGETTRFQADILAERRIDDTTETLLIECMMPAMLSEVSLRNTIRRLKQYGDTQPERRIVLAVPATLRPSLSEQLRSDGIELWDMQYLAEHFAEHIEKLAPSAYRAILLSQMVRFSKPSREKKLLKALSTCPPGKEDWLVYQKLAGEILECLFSPPLESPIPELSDRSKSNRRDFIMANYAEQGFWSFMRTRYQADYVIIDAKNYRAKLNKTSVLQISNYLKAHGAGLFGILMSRNGGDSSGCEQTLHEQWIVSRKLILVLDDDDVKDMLSAKDEGRSPDELLGRKIEKFRLSM